jgi:hypothetical protein
MALQHRFPRFIEQHQYPGPLPLFYNAAKGEAPHVAYTVNGNRYRYAYWLADGIYSTYACFVKTFPKPATRMQKMIATAQEAKRKDIERVSKTDL